MEDETSGARTQKTSLLLNPQERLPDQRTYVLLGCERGGTSLVAGVARALGLYLGDVPEGNNEDPAFHNRPVPQMRKTIQQRDESHDVWGWKFPTAVNYLPMLIKWLRNPRFVVVYRDAVATALSRSRWDGPFLRRTPQMALHETNAVTNANTSFALASGRPCLLVSSEKATGDVSALVDEVADFLGVEPPGEEYRHRIVEYGERGRYKKFDDHFPDLVRTGEP